MLHKVILTCEHVDEIPETDLGGGCRECTPPPPPPLDDLRFSNTTGILQKKKNYVAYWS